MSYATQSDVASYIYNDETATDQLPDDIDRLIARAEELIDEAMFGNYDSDNAEHQQAAKKATAAQIEYWLSFDEEIDIINYVDNMSMGNLDMSMDGITKLAPRAKRELFLAGLLYTGVGSR